MKRYFFIALLSACALTSYGMMPKKIKNTVERFTQKSKNKNKGNPTHQTISTKQIAELYKSDGLALAVLYASQKQNGLVHEGQIDNLRAQELIHTIPKELHTEIAPFVGPYAWYAQVQNTQPPAIAYPFTRKSNSLCIVDGTTVYDIRYHLESYDKSAIPSLKKSAAFYPISSPYRMEVITNQHRGAKFFIQGSSSFQLLFDMPFSYNTEPNIRLLDYALEQETGFISCTFFNKKNSTYTQAILKPVNSSDSLESIAKHTYPPLIAQIKQAIKIEKTKPPLNL